MRAFSLITLVALAACARQVPAPHFQVATAESLAARWVAFDTIGAWDSASSLVLPCEGDQARDNYLITNRVQIQPARFVADTARVVVLFDYIGLWWTEDAHRAGPKNVRFKQASGVDTATLDVVADSSGHLGIVCGPFSPQHMRVSDMPHYFSKLDDSSRADFERATSGSR